MKPEITKDVLSSLIKHLRMLEIKDGEKPMDMHDISHDDEKDEGSPEEEKMDLEEPDLEVGEMHDDSEALTPAQEKIRDFFNNRRPKGNSNDKKSRTFMMDAKVVSSAKPKGKFR